MSGVYRYTFRTRLPIIMPPIPTKTRICEQRSHTHLDSPKPLVYRFWKATRLKPFQRLPCMRSRLRRMPSFRQAPPEPERFAARRALFILNGVNPLTPDKEPSISLRMEPWRFASPTPAILSSVLALMIIRLVPPRYREVNPVGTASEPPLVSKQRQLLSCANNRRTTFSNLI